jgi:ribonuclease BN (tRNA processing enzyme)
VKTLALNHFVAADDRSLTDETWTAAVRKEFDGPIVVGRDLLQIGLS